MLISLCNRLQCKLGALQCTLQLKCNGALQCTLQLKCNGALQCTLQLNCHSLWYTVLAAVATMFLLYDITGAQSLQLKEGLQSVLRIGSAHNKGGPLNINIV